MEDGGMPDFQRFNQIANMVKGYALAIGVAVAIGFVWAWWANRQREHGEERGARARAAYQRYLHQALLTPELAEPVLGGPAEIVRYKLFVANLLAIADEILILCPTVGWRDTLMRQLVPHRSLLVSREFHDSTYRDCTPEVRALIDRVADTGGSGRVMTYPDVAGRGIEPLRQSGSRANTG
jgi:hypothetical protein